jgi:hypothetical protein
MVGAQKGLPQVWKQSKTHLKFPQIGTGHTPSAISPSHCAGQLAFTSTRKGESLPDELDAAFAGKLGAWALKRLWSFRVDLVQCGSQQIKDHQSSNSRFNLEIYVMLFGLMNSIK